jgi:hypothetical protein
MIQITLSVDARADLLDYLEAHKQQIRLGGDGFEQLRSVFRELIGRDAIAPSAPSESISQMSQSQHVAEFVAGAKWWEYHKTGATMWRSDQDLAEQEAVRRAASAPCAPDPS